MRQGFAGYRRQPPRPVSALVFAATVLLALPAYTGDASAQVGNSASAQENSVSLDEAVLRNEGEGGGSVIPERLRRAVVAFDSREAPGTLIIDTGQTSLYLVLGHGRAIRYGVGVGREGFTWSGVEFISHKAEWPDWHPPAEMIARQPYLPRFIAGGPGNPLGARAMYLGSSVFRIHGTNDPSTIGKFVSSGCIRLTNDDVADLFSRVDVGTKVVVLPKTPPHGQAADMRGVHPKATSAVRSPPAVTVLPSGRQAMTLTISSLY
jgi:lipoprotein-anchoring transpeptidase ErfK/SrfK